MSQIGFQFQGALPSGRVRTRLPTCSSKLTRRGVPVATAATEGCADCSSDGQGASPARRGRVRIEYCTGCRWLLRAGWTAQELLTTFEKELEEVAIAPAATSGTFDVTVDGELLFSRKREGRFPEMKELKQLIRDHIAPDRHLGHSDKKA
mmetsp:Transcript_10989/g.33706  ORF Transcript_10989/g.33706 Transcript_10989/m.33706 type:complete len:150 (-) Transcript_10989:1211-1660(-)